MPHNPAQPCIPAKAMNWAQSESISDEDQNEPGQRMEDIFPGITAKNVYQKPNPRFKTQLKEKS